MDAAASSKALNSFMMPRLSNLWLQANPRIALLTLKVFFSKDSAVSSIRLLRTFIAVASEGDEHIHTVADHVFTVPETIEPLQPLLTFAIHVPLLLLRRYISKIPRASDGPLYGLRRMLNLLRRALRLSNGL